MAGHSQFRNIMHKKGKQDAIRSKLFSKPRAKSRSRPSGLPDPAMNARLRAACSRRGREHAQGQHRSGDQEGVLGGHREL